MIGTPRFAIAAALILPIWLFLIPRVARLMFLHCSGVLFWPLWATLIFDLVSAEAVVPRRDLRIRSLVSKLRLIPRPPSPPGVPLVNLTPNDFHKAIASISARSKVVS